MTADQYKRFGILRRIGKKALRNLRRILYSAPWPSYSMTNETVTIRVVRYAGKSVLSGKNSSYAENALVTSPLLSLPISITGVVVLSRPADRHSIAARCPSYPREYARQTMQKQSAS
ncbi:MAG: hypothetical protein HGA57_08155 [Chlorobium limicola]|uniref:hypothetical protein n=1 Tax=Chlorobium limicola TaxID=1092 RepID=UPI0023EFB236|nr:hypothetical protein [Chlorobium limicola]NTV21341.1 hypothetical protein [Chlorobium limicola]